MKSTFLLLVMLTIIAMMQIDVSAQYTVSSHRDDLKASVDMGQFHESLSEKEEA